MLGESGGFRYPPIGSLIFTGLTEAAEEGSGRHWPRTRPRAMTAWGAAQVPGLRVVFRARLAEIAGEYLKKGSQIYVEGRLRTRKWQDKEGQDRYTTEIVADTMKMLGSRGGAGEPRGESAREPAAEPVRAAEPKAAPKKSGGKFDDMEDDIPF